VATIEERWLRLEPIKVGWLGMEWARFRREIQMAFDEGIERGVLDRRYEFLFEDDAGLPQGTAQAGIDSFSRLVDAGCLAVVGANYTDSAIALAEHANALRVPLISMCGTDLFHGEYCFRLGNGDVGDRDGRRRCRHRGEGDREEEQPRSDDRRQCTPDASVENAHPK